MNVTDSWRKTSSLDIVQRLIYFWLGDTKMNEGSLSISKCDFSILNKPATDEFRTTVKKSSEFYFFFFISALTKHPILNLFTQWCSEGLWF